MPTSNILLAIALLLGSSLLGSALNATTDTWSMHAVEIASSSFAVNGEQALRNAISAANAQARQVLIIITSDLVLTRSLPTLAFGSNVIIRGRCFTTRGSPRKCMIDGGKKLPFLTGSFNCYITLEMLTLTHFLNGVHSGGCQVKARRVDFVANSATTSAGGAVLSARASSPTSGSPDVFVWCTFINNTASSNGGAINVGRDPVGGPVLQIAHSSFVGNKALTGRGGAIYSEGNTIFLRDVTFTGNNALISGGAIATTAASLTAINCTFTRNTAWRKAGGGALAFSTTANPASVLLCGTRFAANLSPQRPFAADVAGMAASGSLRVCGGSAFSGMKLQHADTVHLSTSCNGCSGCPSDCNGAGQCRYDADFSPSCSCSSHYDPSTACTSCLTGYTRSSSCTACSQGFIEARGQCLPCAPIGRDLTLQPLVVYISNVTSAASASSCQKQCAVAQAHTNPHLGYCNLWAYIPDGPSAGACARKCVLFNDPDDCGVMPMQSNKQAGVTYQFMEPDMSSCH